MGSFGGAAGRMLLVAELPRRRGPLGMRLLCDQPETGDSAFGTIGEYSTDTYTFCRATSAVAPASEFLILLLERLLPQPRSATSHFRCFSSEGVSPPCSLRQRKYVCAELPAFQQIFSTRITSPD